MSEKRTSELGLTWDETLFTEESAFEVGYVPEVIHHREKQLQSLQHALKPAVRGSRPLNVLAQGPPGTGKTTAIRHLFDELEDQQGVVPVRVNCQMDTTRFHVFFRIYDAVLGHRPPASGVSFSVIFEEIAQQLIQNDEILVVGLDDINYLCYANVASEVLNSLLRAHETYPDMKTGVVVVSSDTQLDVINSLDQQVRSMLQPEGVDFPGYDTLEAREILADRVRVGFCDGVVPSNILDQVAGMTSETGDLRVGIDILRRAGLKAESEGRTQIATEDITTVYEKSMSAHVSRRLSGLSESEIAVVRAVVEHNGSQSGEVFEAFEAETGLQYSRFADLVTKLDQSGVIDATDDVEEQGNTRILTTEYSIELFEEKSAEDYL